MCQEVRKKKVTNGERKKLYSKWRKRNSYVTNGKRKKLNSKWRKKKVK